MVGEIGLDYFFIKDSSRYPAQRKVFEFFLDASRDQNKVVNVHTKGAEQDVLELLIKHRVNRVIIHWYSGPLDVLWKLVDYGAYLTIGPEVLYSEHICEIAALIPWNQLLTETDNPGGPQSILGSIGMPLLIRDVVRRLAQLRNRPCNYIIQTVSQNMLRLAENDPWLEPVSKQLLGRKCENTQHVI